jgi:hypothetical protein
MHLNISQLSELTGRERRRIAKQLKDLQYTAGEWGAMLYGQPRRCRSSQLERFHHGSKARL